MQDECGRVKYSRIAESSAFTEGLERIRTGSERMTVALMCAEKDPLYCHRGILISRQLVARGMLVVHIHADGQTEAHRRAEDRLLRLVGLREPDLFRSDEQILADAYERQEARIAYVTSADQSRHRALR